jgi:hypothetical protein
MRYSGNDHADAFLQLFIRHQLGTTTNPPRCRAAAKPALVHSSIKLLSTEAKAANSGKIALPPALLVSIDSVNDLNPTPRRSNSCTVSMRWTRATCPIGSPWSRNTFPYATQQTPSTCDAMTVKQGGAASGEEVSLLLDCARGPIGCFFSGRLRG